MTIDQLEEIMADAGYRPGEESPDWEAYIASRRFDPEPVGIFCARLAQQALWSVDPADQMYGFMGPKLTSVALCAFEAALRLSDARGLASPVPEFLVRMDGLWDAWRQIQRVGEGAADGIGWSLATVGDGDDTIMRLEIRFEPTNQEGD